MKQAILISAYKNFNHLEEIVNFFNADFTFYIHIDKKIKLPAKEVQKLESNKKVTLLSRKYVTNWGGLNTLKSILFLTKEALKDSSIEYVHMISGGDFPIKDSGYFSGFLNKNKGKQFIETHELPNKRWADGGMNRLHHYNLYDVFDPKGYWGARAIRYSLKFQKAFKLQRKISTTLPKLYGGSTWWTLSVDCLKYVIDYTDKNPELLKRMKYTFCSEEIYFQTVIMTSPFAKSIVNDSLRYILWEYKYNTIPGILDEKDFPILKESTALFARKFDYPYSAKLLTLVKQTL